jgi:DNA-binding NarL/FixJ family response regulator
LIAQPPSAAEGLTGLGKAGPAVYGGDQQEKVMAERFERHRQPWRQDEIQKLHQLAGKGMSLKAIAKALTRSEESVKDRAKQDKLNISKLR